MRNVYEIQSRMKLIWVMYKEDTVLNYISEQAVVIYLPGRGGDKNEFPFLKKFIVTKKKISFFSLSYSLQDSNKKKYAIKEIVLEIEKTITSFLDNHNFKKCYLMGYSLGAALALEIASRKLTGFNKLILLSIFDDRQNLLKERGINIDNYENISPINLIKKNKKTPTIFIHGAFDISVDAARGLKVYNCSDKLNNEFIMLPTDHYFNKTQAKKLLLKSLENIL